MNTEFIQALADLEEEKNISRDVLLEAIESALISAYRKNYGTSQNVRVNINRESGDVEVRTGMTVVEEVYDPMVEISLVEAQSIDPRYGLDDIIEFQVMPENFGRIAAQTAKQVVVQRIREAERGQVYDEFIGRKGEIVNGTVHRKSRSTVFVDLGKTEGILTRNEQPRDEEYEINERIKVFIMDVKDAGKGPQVFLSRSHPGLVKRLFELEVPEIQDGLVEIRGIAREAGSRTKMAVWTDSENVDPVGACVGTRGSRVQAVVDELDGEKIDIIQWNEDPAVLISNVLSPAEAEEVIINEEENMATVIVPDYQLSLAIGKEGQNVRLAAKVSGWKIDIKSRSQMESEKAEEIIELATLEDEDVVASEAEVDTAASEAEEDTAASEAEVDAAASEAEVDTAASEAEEDTAASEAEEAPETDE